MHVHVFGVKDDWLLRQQASATPQLHSILPAPRQPAALPAGSIERDPEDLRYRRQVALREVSLLIEQGFSETPGLNVVTAAGAGPIAAALCEKEGGWSTETIPERRAFTDCEGLDACVSLLLLPPAAPALGAAGSCAPWDDLWDGDVTQLPHRLVQSHLVGLRQFSPERRRLDERRIRTRNVTIVDRLQITLQRLVKPSRIHS
eukprot:758784-Hanusia_phi.AAC.12